MDKHNRFAHLLELYISGNISADEHAELFDFLATPAYDDLLSKSIYKDLRHDPLFLAADLPPHLAEEVVRNIFNAEKNTSRILPFSKMPRYRRWITAAFAAVVIALVGIAGYLLLAREHAPISAAIRVNDASQKQSITLEEGTNVTLQPHSLFRHPQKFAADKREVFLEGEAFFEVTDNPARPFLVYYDNIVIRALGTAFTVKTNAQTGDIEVVVKTGKVQVYKNDKLAKDSNRQAIIVVPNQKLVYRPQ